MVQKIGEEMVENIVFFSKFLFFIFIVSCNRTMNSDNEYNYFNFSNSKEKQVDTLINISKIEGLEDDLTYCFKNKVQDSIYNPYFIYNKKYYKLPKTIENSKDIYNYSLMPQYVDTLMIARKMKFNKDISALLIRGENPDCNGFNCQSYFLHLLIYDENSLLDNKIFVFNSNKITFNNFILIKDKNNSISLLNKSKVIYKFNI